MSNDMQTASRFVIERKSMICGSDEAESRTFKMALDGKGCVWFYTLEGTNPGGYVYVHDPSDDKSDGFGGSTITFKIGKSGSYAAKGPWHTNTDALYQHTQIDLRSKHLTFGCIGKARSYERHQMVIEDLIFCDSEPVLAAFNRIESLAKDLANELNQQLYYYSESSGGSSSGPVWPTGKSPWELREAAKHVS